ncbi:MAG: ParA family protein [Actinomycetota bacterium]|nr:ParA family protein [Actinomycetota bacterium]
MIETRYSYSYRKDAPRIIAVSSQKGGVGKSTTAVNVATYLGEFGYRTILVDMDPQGSSTVGLGINHRKLNNSIYDSLIHNEDPNNVIMETPYNNLALLPSGRPLSNAEIELSVVGGREFRLKNIFENIDYDFDFIIIDCSPTLGVLTTNALVSASEVLIPMQCEYYALEGITRLVETINEIKKVFNEPLEITGIVFTMYLKTVLSRQIIKQVKSYLPDKVFKTIIPKNVKLVEAPGMGEPIKTYNPSCRGARAYESLTREIIEAKNSPLKKNFPSLPRRIINFWDTGAAPRHATK